MLWVAAVRCALCQATAKGSTLPCRPHKRSAMTSSSDEPHAAIDATCSLFRSSLNTSILLPAPSHSYQRPQHPSGLRRRSCCSARCLWPSGPVVDAATPAPLSPPITSLASLAVNPHSLTIDHRGQDTSALCQMGSVLQRLWPLGLRSRHMPQATGFPVGPCLATWISRSLDAFPSRTGWAKVSL